VLPVPIGELVQLVVELCQTPGCQMEVIAVESVRFSLDDFAHLIGVAGGIFEFARGQVIGFLLNGFHIKDRSLRTRDFERFRRGEQD